ncbi:hypothetical protein BKA70DRAFT_1276361, partial [Coprinopsis sp. MPI-PUGE-AT-0042]
MSPSRFLPLRPCCFLWYISVVISHRSRGSCINSFDSYPTYILASLPSVTMYIHGLLPLISCNLARPYHSPSYHSVH